MDFVSYQQQAINLNQLNDVVIDRNTLINGQGILYNSTSKKWENSDISGGGGGGLTGTNLAALFLDGTQGNAFGDAITSNVSSTGFAMNVDRTNKRIGINKNNPTVSLDVAGNTVLGGNLTVDGIADFTDNLQTITISEQKIGLTSAAPNELKLYSANLPAVPSGLTTVDSVIKRTGSSAFRSYDPDVPDVANTTDEDSIYKMRLSTGTTRQTVATPAFDIQEPFPVAPPLGFPTYQIVEYQNKVPLHKPICTMRSAGPIVISPATVRIISVLGQRRGVPFFDDNVIYDPLNMRSRLTATGWNKFGAPVVYRTPDLKVGWTISWSIHTTWLSGSSGSNRCDLYLNQFRNGVALRSILLQQMEANAECWLIGKRTMLSWTTTYNEDFDPSQDDYELEISNQSSGGGHDLQFNQSDCEAECWITQ